MEGPKTGSMTREALKEKVRELANLSRDLENLTRQMSGATSTIQVTLLKERMDQLTVGQRKLVEEIAECCPFPDLKSRFDDLDMRLESVRRQVKDCKESDVLETLRQEIDPLVEQWAEVFQQLVVATLQSAA